MQNLYIHGLSDRRRDTTNPVHATGLSDFGKVLVQGKRQSHRD